MIFTWFPWAGALFVTSLTTFILQKILSRKFSREFFCDFVLKSWRNPTESQYSAIVGNTIEKLPNWCETSFENM